MGGSIVAGGGMRPSHCCWCVCVTREDMGYFNQHSDLANFCQRGAARCYRRIRPKAAIGTTILSVSAKSGIRAQFGTGWGANCAQGRGPSMAAPQLHTGGAHAQQTAKQPATTHVSMGPLMHTSPHATGRRTVDSRAELVKHGGRTLSLRIAYRNKFPFPTRHRPHGPWLNLIRSCKRGPGNALAGACTASVLLIAILASTDGSQSHQANFQRTLLDCSSNKDQLGPTRISL